MIKIKPRRTADCVVGGFRYLSGRGEVGSLLLGLYDDAGRLDTSVSPRPFPTLNGQADPPVGGDARAAGLYRECPGGPSRWSTERSSAWEPLRPELVVEVGFDQVTAGRFRHGTTLLRWRPDKAPRQCTADQLDFPRPLPAG